MVDAISVDISNKIRQEIINVNLSLSRNRNFQTSHRNVDATAHLAFQQHLRHRCMMGAWDRQPQASFQAEIRLLALGKLQTLDFPKKAQRTESK